MGVLFKNTSVTIYNKYYDNLSGYDKYQRTIIENVDWQGKSNATVTDKGLLMADSVLIFVDKLANYISPKKFAILSDAARVNYFTLGMSDKVVKGVIDFEVTGLKPYSIANLESIYDDVVNIISTRPLSDHWEVECK